MHSDNPDLIAGSHTVKSVCASLAMLKKEPDVFLMKLKWIVEVFFFNVKTPNNGRNTYVRTH